MTIDIKKVHPRKVTSSRKNMTYRKNLSNDKFVHTNKIVLIFILLKYRKNLSNDI